MEHLGTTVRTRLSRVDSRVTIKPLAETAVTEGMTTLGREGLVHETYTYSTGHELAQFVEVALEHTRERWLA